jgi:hypothetical protein
MQRMKAISGLLLSVERSLERSLRRGRSTNKQCCVWELPGSQEVRNNLDPELPANLKQNLGFTYVYTKYVMEFC